MNKVDKLVYAIIEEKKLNSDEETVNNIRYGLTLENPDIVNWMYMKYVQGYNASTIALFEKIDDWRRISAAITYAMKRIVSAKLFDVKNRDIKIKHMHDLISYFIDEFVDNEDEYDNYIINQLRSNNKINQKIKLLKDDDIINSIIAMTDEQIRVFILEYVIHLSAYDISIIIHKTMHDTITKMVEETFAFHNYHDDIIDELNDNVSKLEKGLNTKLKKE